MEIFFIKLYRFKECVSSIYYTYSMYFYSIQHFSAEISASRNAMNRKHLFIRFDQKESN